MFKFYKDKKNKGEVVCDLLRKELMMPAGVERDELIQLINESSDMYLSTGMSNKSADIILRLDEELAEVREAIINDEALGEVLAELFDVAMCVASLVYADDANSKDVMRSITKLNSIRRHVLGKCLARSNDKALYCYLKRVMKIMPMVIKIKSSNVIEAHDAMICDGYDDLITLKRYRKEVIGKDIFDYN